FQQEKAPVLCVISKADVISNEKDLQKQIKEQTKLSGISVTSTDKSSIERFKEELIKIVPDDFDNASLTGEFVREDDVILLVMPQDIQAPKGRLILPQVQTIRDLLENKCVVICTTTDKLETTLSCLKNPPTLIITDSQVFKNVYSLKPKVSKLTSFSVLFANYKGDLDYFVKSAFAIEKLTEQSKILIAEACSHAPLEEDIGRVKIPALLRKRFGEKLTIDFVRGTDFPKDLSDYDLVIQCGGCMFGKKYLMSRVETAQKQGIPMTNYGVVIAYLCGILEEIDTNIKL
ncbi:MAG: [FeFe] hydrogenase H-cluster maturation GTPase HydF, partial [Oscillospiraceae bacterium]